MFSPGARAAGLFLLVTGCTYQEPVSAGAPSDGPAAQPQDVLPDPELCTNTTDAECLGNTLRECRAMGALPVDTLCAMCVSAPDAHCETLVPSANGASAADLIADSTILDITIPNEVEVDTDSGQIQGIRDGGEGVVDGIGFAIVNNIAVWRFHSLTINGKLSFRGNHAAVFAANRTIDVNAELDLKGECDGQTAGPGGTAGGIGEQDGVGDGKGLKGNGQTNAASGGSGGGHGTVGANGGSATNETGPAGGSVFGDAVITVLRGGSGGGGGGGATTTAGVGGGGGGAIHLVANDRITFTAQGKINAGGCGAERASVNPAGGGGGGAGGTILIEASAIELATAVLSVNGGAGSGGDILCSSGENGKGARSAAVGGNGTGLSPSGNSGGRGGNGGTGFSVPASGSSGTENKNAGGGGGGIGRIRINTRGDANLGGSCATCSPKFEDPGSTLTRGAVQILQVN